MCIYVRRATPSNAFLINLAFKYKRKKQKSTSDKCPNISIVLNCLKHKKFILKFAFSIEQNDFSFCTFLTVQNIILIHVQTSILVLMPKKNKNIFLFVFIFLIEINKKTPTILECNKHFKTFTQFIKWNVNARKISSFKWKEKNPLFIKCINIYIEYFNNPYGGVISAPMTT